MDGVVWFGVLGPLEVTASGRPVTVAGRSQRELPAVLLLRANKPVEVDFMIDSLWPGRSPPSARGQIQNSVGRLRRTLVAGGVPATTLETRRGGYLLRVLPGELDVLSFAWQVESGRRLACAPPWRCGEAGRSPSWTGRSPWRRRDGCWRTGPPFWRSAWPWSCGSAVITRSWAT